jgi:hypothetical protein
MCPPGVDQTERSEQHWNLLVPGVQGQIPIASNNKSILANLLSGSEKYPTFTAWDLLALPPNGAGVNLARLSTVQRHMSLSHLESLPSELISQIVGDEGLSMEDVMSLGLASDLLWIHVLTHIQRSAGVTDFPPILAGQSIACIGTYVEDLPEPFMHDHFMQLSIGFQPYGSPSTCLARQMNWGCLATYLPLATCGPEDEWIRLFRAASDDNPIQLNAVMEQELRCCSSRLRNIGWNSKWVLRNLTTKEYVCIVPMLESPNHPNGSPALHQMGFVDPDYTMGSIIRLEDVLLMMFCWTRKFDARPYLCSEYVLLERMRGIWAGHAFDVVCMKDFYGAYEWTNATAGIVKLAREFEELMKPPLGAIIHLGPRDWTVPRLLPDNLSSFLCFNR